MIHFYSRLFTTSGYFARSFHFKLGEWGSLVFVRHRKISLNSTKMHQSFQMQSSVEYAELLQWQTRWGLKCARTFQTMRKRLRVRPAYDLFINACTQINQIYDGYGKGNNLLKEAYALCYCTLDHWHLGRLLLYGQKWVSRNDHDGRWQGTVKVIIN